MNVYDASALLAVAFDEPGGDAVIDLLAGGGCISTVNWAEVATCLVDHGAKPAAVAAELAHFALDVVPLDAATAWRAAALRTPTRALGLSLGGRCCLALAQALDDAVVVTADRVWKSLRGFRVALVR